ncbi:uncharacterized protein EAE98_010514 [Botrytis deweyae]|uniref:2EXR domain-containing protein n=1 Tax=Botrytis deweyae TaxID=2478750 RepID=A0ABQ7I8G0_9HELO|nr:uncharacterized protein EAE98_010514 [Botrytis deweyae]KAF7916792.1 hypothetical protein EAE98_010514 [Botrytis deweyae]
MDGDHALSRVVRGKLTRWKARAGSIGRWRGRKNPLKRTRSSAKKAVAPIDSSLVQGDDNEPDNHCGRMFHPFSRLPIELRLGIWRMSWDSRSIGIVTKYPFASNMLGTVTGVKKGTSPPSTISVNRESRAETLLHYKPLNFAPLALGFLVSKFYFNNELDTLAVYVTCVFKLLDSKLYQAHAGLINHCLSTAKLRDIKSLLVFPCGEAYGYYQVFSFGDHEINTNPSSAYSYLHELILLADSHIKGITYKAPNNLEKSIPFGYTRQIPGHPTPPGQQSIKPGLSVHSSHWKDVKSYGIFRSPPCQEGLIKKFRMKYR